MNTIYRVPQLDGPQESSELSVGTEFVRVARFLSLLPISQTIMQEDNTTNAPVKVTSLVDFRVQVEVSAFLAIQDLNSRSNRILSKLSTMLQSCDIQFALEMRDTQFSPIEAIRQLLISMQMNSTKHNQGFLRTPTAIIGAALSAESEVVSVLGGVYEIPEISSSSTSGALDNKDSAPFFARTIPTNTGDAKAIIAYFRMLQVSNFAVLYVNDDYGNYYAQALSDSATANGLQIELVSFEDSVNASIKDAVVQLQQSELRYFVGVLNANNWRQVARTAYRGGIMGRPDYTWLLSDAVLEITQPGFSLNQSSDYDLVQAIHGVGVVSLSLPNYPPFDRALSEFYLNHTLQKEFVASHPNFRVFDGYKFKFSDGANSTSNSLLYQYLTYDAVISMGLAACNTPTALNNGPSVYQTLLNVMFQGASGLVRFSNTTGTRLVGDVSYSVQNVLALPKLFNNDVVDFHARVTAQIYPSCDGRIGNCSIHILNPFVYADNTAIPPPPLPALQQNFNLIPLYIRIVGWVLCAVVIFVSIGWVIWTYRFRNKDVVRASQPIFLVVICFGCCIMASAIIPLSLQEPASTKVLNASCMATPWLLSVGFVLTFSAMFSKTWRLNKIFFSGQGFRRVRLRPHDVIIPLVAMMLLNVVVLTAWTVVSPLKWARIPKNSNVDLFGRYPDSFGTCYGKTNQDYAIVFLCCVLVVDMIALVVANYQSYVSRNISTEFSESFYVAVSMASLLEAVILGAPIVFLLRGNPSAFFLVLSILICITCLIILLPIFLPKYLLRNLHQRRPPRRGRGTIAIDFDSVLSTTKSDVRESIREGRQHSLASVENLIGATKIARSAEYFERRNSAGTSESEMRQPLANRRRVVFFDGPTETSSQSRESVSSQDRTESRRKRDFMDSVESISEENCTGCNSISDHHEHQEYEPHQNL